MRKIFIKIITSLIMIIFLMACQKNQENIQNKEYSNQETVKIAVVAPMTGDNSEYGLGFYNAAMLKAKFFRSMYECSSYLSRK